jgi:hypothetical protein
MAEARFSAEESRKLAVLIARAWSDAQLASDYERDPDAVLRGAGINLGARAAPTLPPKPAELEAQPLAAMASGSSASSISCATCPCSGCTASCACPSELSTLGLPTETAILELAADPQGRQRARELIANWDIKLNIRP